MSGEATFHRRVKEWLNWLMEISPVGATQLGEFRWNDRLADWSAQALESQNQEMLTWLAEFQAVDTAGWELDAQIDHTLVVHIIKSFVRNYEKLELHLRDPG